MREAPLPPGLRLLKWLVILLTLTMIVGVITIVAVLVTRIPQTFGHVSPILPPTLTLPEGLTAGAITLGQTWIAVVARDDTGAEQIVIFGADGTLRQQVPITPWPETP